MMKIIDSLTPKNILFGVMKEKFAEANVSKIMIVFPLKDEHYNVMLSTKHGENMKLDLTASEINTIKKIFIRRIVAKWNERYDIEPKDVIIQVDLEKDSLEIFIQNTKDEVLKFDY